MKPIKKGFNAACRRPEIEDLRPYDLRHTFATRLLERGVHHYVISALVGHSTPVVGGGFGSRMTSGYAHVSWEAMVRAVEILEQPIFSNPRIFVLDSGKIPAKPEKAQKAGLRGTTVTIEGNSYSFGRRVGI